MIEKTPPAGPWPTGPTGVRGASSEHPALHSNSASATFRMQSITTSLSLSHHERALGRADPWVHSHEGIRRAAHDISGPIDSCGLSAHPARPVSHVFSERSVNT